jgi:DHA1 family tetracycline resistance protein-like MFS transporter
MPAFGGGLTFCAHLVRWGERITPLADERRRAAALRAQRARAGAPDDGGQGQAAADPARMTPEQALAARKRILPVVAMALFIDSMGIGIVLPVAPKLVMELTGLPLSEAAPIGGWLTVAYALMQFLFSPVLGNLSDKFGRKPILMASLAALAVDYLIMGFAPTLFWLFVGRLVAGVAGATFATANAVVADLVPQAERAKFFGMNGAAWGMGFIVGPVVGGLLGQYGSRVPFFAAAAFTAVNFLIALMVLRETLPERIAASSRCGAPTCSVRCARCGR